MSGQRNTLTVANRSTAPNRQDACTDVSRKAEVNTAVGKEYQKTAVGLPGGRQSWPNSGPITMVPVPMRTSKSTLTHNGHADETEAAFYEALQLGDIDKLMACWADEDDIVCVHPGGARSVGVLAIRGAFEALFAHGTVRAQVEHVRRVETLGASIHSVLERVQVMTGKGPAQAYVIATNVYLKTPQGWRMVAHHASPGTVREQPLAGDAPAVLH